VYCAPTPPQAGSTDGPPRPGRLNTTPMSRPPLKEPLRASGPAAASSKLTPSASINGRER